MVRSVWFSSSSRFDLSFSARASFYLFYFTYFEVLILDFWIPDFLSFLSSIIYLPTQLMKSKIFSN
jgi:hypothetical protein